MNTKILIFTHVLFLTGTLLSSCKSPSEKVKNAQNDFKDAEMQKTEAQKKLNKELNNSIQLFKAKSKLVISNNEKSIVALKFKIAEGNKANNAEYKKLVVDLEQKNSELKIKLEEYNDEKATQWQEFKSEIKKDMDNLGKAISDITVDNVK